MSDYVWALRTGHLHLVVSRLGCWCTYLFDKKHEDFCRFGAAGVPRYRVNVIGRLVKRLPRNERLWLTTSNLHDDCALEDINKCMRVVAVTGRGHAGRILDFEYNGLAPFDVRQVCLEQSGCHRFLGQAGCRQNR